MYSQQDVPEKEEIRTQAGGAAYIIANDLIASFNSPDRREVLSEIKRILRAELQDESEKALKQAAFYESEIELFKEI